MESGLWLASGSGLWLASGSGLWLASGSGLWLALGSGLWFNMEFIFCLIFARNKSLGMLLTYGDCKKYFLS